MNRRPMDPRRTICPRLDWHSLRMAQRPERRAADAPRLRAMLSGNQIVVLQPRQSRRECSAPYNPIGHFTAAWSSHRR